MLLGGSLEHMINNKYWINRKKNKQTNLFLAWPQQSWSCFQLLGKIVPVCDSMSLNLLLPA